MSISINGSTGISGVDGSAATPALQGGDTNTGISFGTDEVRINTGGTQRAVVDASGRLGLGTSDPGSLNAVLAVQKSQTADTAIVVDNSGTAGASTTSSFIVADGGTTRGWFRRYRDGSGNTAIGFSDALLFEGNIGGTKATRMVVDASGNVGVGASTPVSYSNYTTLSLRGKTSTTGGVFQSENSTQTTQAYWYTDNNQSLFGTITAHPQVFVTQNTERMRLDSNGRLLVGTSTSQGSYNLQCFGTGVWGQGAYVNGSDASLKENVQDLESALDVVKAMRPVTFQYKSEYSQDTSTQSGFIAQELQQAMQGKQYLDGIVKPGTNHLNVAYQGIIAVLVKAVQELEAEVQALKGGN